MPEEIVKATITFDTKGLGGTFGGGGTVAAGDTGGGTGGGLMTKGIGGALTKMALPLMALGKMKDIAVKTFNVLKESSPALQATASIGKKAFNIALRPFGNLLSSLLRPALIWLLRMSIQFLKWSKTFNMEKLGEKFADIGGKISDFFSGETDVGEWLTGKLEGLGVPKGISAAIGGIVDFWFDTFATQFNIFKGFGIFIWEQLVNNLSTAWALLSTIGKFIFDRIIAAWEIGIALFRNFGSIILDLITGKITLGEAWTRLGKLGQWLWDEVTKWVTESFAGVLDLASEVWKIMTTWAAKGWDNLTDFATLVYDSVVAWIQGNIDRLKKFFVWDIGGNEAGEKKDFLMRPGQGAVSFSPQDTIVGFKGNSPFGGGGSNNIVININALDASSIDSNIISKITRAVEESIGGRMAGTSSQNWGYQ